MATHSGILAWRIPWTEKPGGLQPIGWVAESWTQLNGLSMHTWGYLVFPPLSLNLSFSPVPLNLTCTLQSPGVAFKGCQHPGLLLKDSDLISLEWNMGIGVC